MDKTQKLTLQAEWLAKLQTDFCSARVTDEEMCEVLRKANNKLNYVADPHTSVAMAAAEKLGYAFTEKSKKSMPVVILATASPCKFQEAVTTALGKDGWDNWQKLSFPKRAQNTLERVEKEPYHYPWTSGASLSDVQQQWRTRMLDIVKLNF